jgi:PKD repeat protein
VSNGLCTAFDSVFVQFDTPLQASFSIADTIGCAPLVVQIQNSSSTTTSFLWNFGNGVVDSLTFEPTLTYTQPGIYQISLQISDSICQGAASYAVQINVGPSIAVTAPNDLLLCSSIDTTLIPTITGSPSAVLWSSNNNFSDTLNLNGSPNLELIDPQNAWYYIEVSSAYCSATDSVLISILAQDLALTAPALVCQDSPFDITLNFSGNPQQIVWTPSSALLSGQGQATATFEINQAQNIYVSVTTAQNCILQDSVFVNVSSLNPLSVVANANPLVILPNTSTQLLGQPTGAYTYNWSPSQNLSSATTQNPTALLDQTTLFTLTVSDGLCSGSDTVLVKVYDSICQEPFVYIPNAFSPNKDGNNDKLYVHNTDLKKSELTIYNLLGTKVIKSRDWDGQKMTIDIKTWSPGLYLIQYRDQVKKVQIY